MKTLTAKELALYLGCEAEVKWSYHPPLAKHEGRPEQIITSTENINGNILEIAAGYVSIKPILRPLSDITEEELIGLNQIIQPEVEIKPGDLTEAIDQLRKKGIKIIDFSDIPAPVVFETTAYLLSLGFDLFKWIDQGLAISKPAIGIEAVRSTSVEPGP